MELVVHGYLILIASSKLIIIFLDATNAQRAHVASVSLKAAARAPKTDPKLPTNFLVNSFLEKLHEQSGLKGHEYFEEKFLSRQVDPGKRI